MIVLVLRGGVGDHLGPPVLLLSVSAVAQPVEGDEDAERGKSDEAEFGLLVPRPEEALHCQVLCHYKLSATMTRVFSLIAVSLLRAEQNESSFSSSWTC